MIKTNFLLIAFMLISLSNLHKLKSNTNDIMCWEIERPMKDYCSEWKISRNGILRTQCKNNEGIYVESKTSLSCLMIWFDGKLAQNWGGGATDIGVDFDIKKCEFCRFRKGTSILTCNCKNTKSEYVRSSFDINEIFEIIDGKPNCAHCY